MKIFFTLFFSSAVLSQGAKNPEAAEPTSESAVLRSLILPIPEPSTVLLSVMAGALGILRRKRS